VSEKYRRPSVYGTVGSGYSVRRSFLRRAPSALFNSPLPSTAEPYRSLEVEDTSIAWTLDGAISCGNEFVRVTGNQMRLRLLPATCVAFIARDGHATEITFRFDAQAAHVTEDHVTNPIRFCFTRNKAILTFNGEPVKSKRELVEILKTRSSRQGIAKGFFAPDSQLIPGRFLFNRRINPPTGPGPETPPTTSCISSPDKRRAVIVSGEAGSGKSTWSVYSLPQLVGAVHGVLYYSSTDAKRASMFSKIEFHDGEAINSLNDLCGEFFCGLRDHLVAICAAFEEVFASLRTRLLSVKGPDATARALFCSIVSERLAKLAHKDGLNLLSSQCAFLIRTELWETSTRANTYTQYYVQTEPVDLAVVIDDVGRYPAFVRSIVGQCREIYATFQDVFNIRLVIVLCGRTGTELFMDKPGTFSLPGSDPPLAERMLVKAGTGQGIDFADAIINEQKKAGTVPQSFPQARDIPFGRLTTQVWTNARLTAKFLATALALVNLKLSLATLCRVSVEHAYKKFLDLNGLSAYTGNMRRTLTSVAYWALMLSRTSSASETLPEMEIPACLDDGLFLVYEPVRIGVSDGSVGEVSLLLRPATKLTDNEKFVLTKLRDICMLVGLLTIRNGCEYVASPALESAIACGFEAPEVQKGDGHMFEELVSLAAKRAAGVGGFRAIRTALRVGFPSPLPLDGLVYLNNVTELKAAVDALGPIPDAKGITYVGAAVIVTNGPSAQFADIIKICRVHNASVVGATTAVTFYDTKLDSDSLDHRALTSAGCTLAGDQHLRRRECTIPVGWERPSLLPFDEEADRQPSPPEGAATSGGTAATLTTTPSLGASAAVDPVPDPTSAAAAAAGKQHRMFTRADLLLMGRSLVVRMTWQEMAVCRSAELLERIKRINNTHQVTEEASRVRLRLVLQDGKQPGHTVISLPAQVGPVLVRHQLREHVGLYDKLIRDELPDPPVELIPGTDERFESPKTCSRCQCKEEDDELFLVENGTGLFVCDACSTPPPSKDEMSSAQRI
jgi:hypothetical protein